MKYNMMELIKSSATNEYAYHSLESIFVLQEQLSYSTNIKQLAEDIFNWLRDEFKITNLEFSLFDINKNSKSTILSKGNEFFMDDELSHFFIINTHISLNATLSFCANSKLHFKMIEDNYDTIQAAFFQISPIIQSLILKKNFIDSSSLDSVTNVYNRTYLIQNLTNHLRLLNNKQEEIYFLMIGIDRFKAVIDEFDYDIADKVLVELARVIHSNIDSFDLVGRLGTDEFLVSILSNSNEEEIEALALKIIDDFADTNIVVNDEHKQILKKTICIGMDKFILSSQKTINDSIKHSDIALYEAKNKGRSQFLKYSDLTASDGVEIFDESIELF
ncbi:GGDEF domain-containing protein [Arcobacter vandammei]|uniref:GGDEF domain-containing protein n=1 Tax=Arcobacter vandammei TaxID=2782243 RepID=UPI0018DFA66B|nr:GGDEF domain-containing protein [Arcobacter vandammei]